jgi:hypothetical protein
LTTHEDWDFWIRMSRVFTFVHLKQVTCEFRWREDGSTVSSRRRADFLRTAIMVYQKHKACAAGKPEILAGQRKLLAILRDEIDRLAEQERKASSIRGRLRSLDPGRLVKLVRRLRSGARRPSPVPAIQMAFEPAVDSAGQRTSIPHTREPRY